jgi:predicted alpha/beta superfamily hydrolase
MSETVSTELDGRVIRLYRGSGENLPVLYSNDYAESGDAVLRRCRELKCPPFHLVFVSNVGWDQNMSPWPSGPVVAKDDHFEGNAPAYLNWLLKTVIPCAEETLELKNPLSYITGYSMAGLFALWSLYETDFFSGAVCASGSLWYPGFCDFALSHDFRRTPAGIYLSLGDRESAVRNPALQKTEAVFRTLNEHYLRHGLPSVFELNAGNHYRDADLRMAKGYTWLLSL